METEEKFIPSVVEISLSEEDARGDISASPNGWGGFDSSEELGKGHWGQGAVWAKESSVNKPESLEE